MVINVVYNRCFADSGAVPDTSTILCSFVLFYGGAEVSTRIVKKLFLPGKVQPINLAIN